MPLNVRVVAAPASQKLTTIAWTKQPKTAGWPGFTGYTTLQSDPVGLTVLFYGILGASSSIYSSNVFAYTTSTNSYQNLVGTNQLMTFCNPNTATIPGDRHPVGQMAVDTQRNRLWLYGGVCGGVNRNDLWYLTLHADPSQNTWVNVTPQCPGNCPERPNTNDSAMVYNSDRDVLFLWGDHNSSGFPRAWVYHIDTGRWEDVTPATNPPGLSFPGLVYDTLTRKAIQFGGGSAGGIYYNQTWAFDFATKTWRRKALATGPTIAPLNTPLPQAALDPVKHRIFLHIPALVPEDWMYDIALDLWLVLVTTGGGPACNLSNTMALDRRTGNTLVAHCRDILTFDFETWRGLITN